MAILVNIIYEARPTEKSAYAPLGRFFSKSKDRLLGLGIRDISHKALLPSSTGPTLASTKL